MSYKVAIRPDGQDEVKVQVEPKNFKIEEDYESTGVLVEVEYAKARLATQDPDGYKAILAAWPTVDELVLYRRKVGEDSVEWEEVFSGTVNKLDTDDHLITIGGHMVAPVPPNPLTVDVVQDTSDPNRQTVLISADNDEQGAVTLAFGDGTQDGANPGDGVERTTHAFANPGTYTVVATDSDDAERTAQQVVTVPFPA